MVSTISISTPPGGQTVGDERTSAMTTVGELQLDGVLLDRLPCDVEQLLEHRRAGLNVVDLHAEVQELHGRVDHARDRFWDELRVIAPSGQLSTASPA
jgi:hypothetical protein